MSVSAPTSDTRIDQAAPATVAHDASQTDMPMPKKRAVVLRDTIEPQVPLRAEDDADAPRFCACLDGWLPACVISFLEALCSWVSSCCVEESDAPAPVEQPEDVPPKQIVESPGLR